MTGAAYVRERNVLAGAWHFSAMMASDPKDTFRKVARGMFAPRDILPLSRKVAAGFELALGTAGIVIGSAHLEPVEIADGAILAGDALDTYLSAAEKMGGGASGPPVAVLH